MLKQLTRFASALALLTTVFPTYVSAQQVQRTEIDVSQISWTSGTPPMVLSNPGAATVTIETDISPMPSTVNNQTSLVQLFYANTVQSIQVTFYDFQMNPIATQSFWGQPQTATNTSTSVIEFFSDTSQGQVDRVNWILSDTPALGQQQFFNVILYNTNQSSLFTSLTHYPQLVTGVPPTTFRLRMEGYEQSTNDYALFNSVVDEVRVYPPDADGDGVADALDQCTTSALDATVMFNGYNSTVTNYVDANGCTIMDRYAACQGAETVTGPRGIRSVRRGPSYCEKMVSYALVAEGIISYAEARLLRDALYASYRNPPPA